MDTNSILLAVQLLLPVFNDFAQKADLGIPLPLTTKAVTKAQIGSHSPSVMVVFADRFRFDWTYVTNTATNYLGVVNFEDYQHSVGRVDRPKVFPRLSEQKSLIDSKGAVALGSNCLWRLGYYNTNWFETPAKVKQFAWSPKIDDPNVPLMPLPFFTVLFPPVHQFGFIDGTEEYAFKIEVSGLDKRVVSLKRLTSSCIERSSALPLSVVIKMLEPCSLELTNYCPGLPSLKRDANSL